MRKITNRNWGMFLAAVTGLALALPTAVMAAPAPTLTWHLDEPGATPIALDASGNGNNGTSGPFSSVIGGAAGVLDNAYSGFSTPSSNVYSAELDPVAFQQADFSFTAWVKNPDLISVTSSFIARGARNTLGWGSDVPWQVWVTNDGAINLGVQDWEGFGATYTSAPLTWATDQWYQVAVTEDYSIVGDQRYAAFKVYVTPAGSTTVGTPVLEPTYNNLGLLNADGSAVGLGQGGLANGGTLVVGAGNAGYYSYSPTGNFGGQIDEVNLWVGTTLSTEELNSTLVPEPASLGLLGLACTAMLSRRRSRMQ